MNYWLPYNLEGVDLIDAINVTESQVIIQNGKETKKSCVNEKIGLNSISLIGMILLRIMGIGNQRLFLELIVNFR